MAVDSDYKRAMTGTRTVASATYVAPSPEHVAALHEYYKCAHDHRAYMNIMMQHSQRGYGLLTPALNGTGTDVTCDWTYFDERFGPVLSGELFDDNEPVPVFQIGFNLHWPWGYSHDVNREDHRLNWCQGESTPIDPQDWENAGSNRRDCSILIEDGGFFVNRFM